MQNNEVGLATYLSRRLNPEYKVLARKWIQIHKNPYKNTRKPNLLDNKTSREIIFASQVTPDIPFELFPSAPIIPATCVP